jgi:IS30 family transposase
MKHKHLTYEQRYSIEIMLKTKINKKVIYESLGIPGSTFYRELKRNSKPRSYQSKHAQMLANERKRE